MTAKLLVIGGAGYFGSVTKDRLEQLEDVDVWGAGRRPVSAETKTVSLDITDPEELSKLTDFVVVVNCSDSSAAPPDQLVEHCLIEGQVLFEMTADPTVVERLIDTFVDLEAPPSPPSRIPAS